MSKTDKWMNIILIACIAIYISVWIAGLVKHELVIYSSFLNALTGLLLITYWIQNEKRITQHFIETREIVVLSIEALIVAISVYSISSASLSYWVKITQHIIFGIHFACLVLFLIFMLTFKMNRLI